MNCDQCSYQADSLYDLDYHIIHSHLLPKTKCSGCTQPYIYDEEFHHKKCVLKLKIKTVANQLKQ